MMIKRRKIVLFIIIGVFALLLLIRIYLYLNACVIHSRNEAAFLAETLMMHPENANAVIPYEMLSNEYKSEISSEEYKNAMKPQNSRRGGCIIAATPRVLRIRDIFIHHTPPHVKFSLNTAVPFSALSARFSAKKIPL